LRSLMSSLMSRKRGSGRAAISRARFTRSLIVSR
jgi:hypothetical protein